LADLANVHKPSESEYLNCIRCGLCLAVCPTYREQLSEAPSPRGRAVLARKGLEGELELTPQLIEHMYSCFYCLACHDICPVGIRSGDLAVEMRHVQEQLQPVAWKKALFGSLVARPERLEHATLPLRLYQGLGVRRMVYSLKMRKLMPGRLRDMEAMLPNLPWRPLRQGIPETIEPQGPTRYRIGFFLGCAQTLAFAHQTAASLRVLTRNGCAVVTPKAAVCCGMPAIDYGHRELVEQQARHNIALYEAAGVDAVVTDCATCGSMLREYRKLLAHDPEWAKRAATFADRVRDISEFLVQIGPKPPRGKIKAKVTYHDPCHLRRAQKVWQQPRSLLQGIEGLEFVELPESNWCCGSAGSQLIIHYETSLGILKRKMDNLESTGAEIVASGCPACQMQLNVGVRKRGLPVQVVHPVALLDRAYGGKREG